MSSDKLKTLTRKVWYCLEINPVTRSDDRALIEMIYDEFYGVWDIPFYEVIRNKKLPSFESIRRCRQKIQEECEELRGIKPVEEARIAKQEEYIAYSQKGLNDGRVERHKGV